MRILLLLVFFTKIFPIKIVAQSSDITFQFRHFHSENDSVVWLEYAIFNCSADTLLLVMPSFSLPPIIELSLNSNQLLTQKQLKRKEYINIYSNVQANIKDSSLQIDFTQEDIAYQKFIAEMDIEQYFYSKWTFLYPQTKQHFLLGLHFPKKGWKNLLLNVRVGKYCTTEYEGGLMKELYYKEGDTFFELRDISPNIIYKCTKWVDYSFKYEN